MILSIVFEGAGDAVAHLAVGVAPTIIRARVVHRPLAGTRRCGGGLRQVAQLVWMSTITVQVLFLGAASVLGALPELAQVGVGVLGGVIATKRALIPDVATGAIAGGGHGGIVAGPDHAVLLVITEVLGFAASGAALAGDRGLGSAATQDIANGIIGDLVVEERGAIALPRRRAARRSQIRIIAHGTAGDGRTEAIGTQIAHPSNQALPIIGERGEIGRSDTVVAESDERARGAIIRLAGGVAAAASHSGLHHHRLVDIVVGLLLLILREGWEGERSSGDGHVEPGGDQAATLVVLPVLGDGALCVVGTGQVIDRHALGQVPDRIIASRPGDAARIGIMGVLDEGKLIEFCNKSTLILDSFIQYDSSSSSLFLI